jgi:hypothetical protein
MSIALAYEVKALREQVATLSAVVFNLQMRIQALEEAEQEPLIGEEPAKRGPGRPRKVVAQ